MKKTIKKHINTALALLLLANILFTSNQDSLLSHSEPITPYGIVDDLEIK